jgi:hypothetical protein
MPPSLTDADAAHDGATKEEGEAKRREDETEPQSDPPPQEDAVEARSVGRVAPLVVEGLRLVGGGGGGGGGLGGGGG